MITAMQAPPWKPMAHLKVPLEDLTRLVTCGSDSADGGQAFWTLPGSAAQNHDECWVEHAAGRAIYGGRWFRCPDCNEVKVDQRNGIHVNRNGVRREQCGPCGEIATHEYERQRAVEKHVAHVAKKEKAALLFARVKR